MIRQVGKVSKQLTCLVVEDVRARSYQELKKLTASSKLKTPIHQSFAIED